MKYKAFISYSHAADGKLAPAFQFALHRFARPWFRVRAMRVFRDKTSLSATPALWPSIEAALEQSEFFLLLASPDAASSSWVEKEVRWWLTNRPLNRLFIVLTEGAIAWNGEGRDFDWKKTTALPCCLKGKFLEEPLHVDLTWARHEEQLSLRHSRFRATVLDIAAPLHGREKEDLDGEDVRENRRTLRLAWTAAVLLVTLALATATAAYFAVEQWRFAEERRRQAEEQLAETLLARGTELARAGRYEESEIIYRQALEQHRLAQKQDLPVLVGLWDLYRRSPVPLYVKPLPRWDTFATLQFLGVAGDGASAVAMSQISHPALDDPGYEPARLHEMDLLTGRVEESATGRAWEMLRQARDLAPGGVSQRDDGEQRFTLDEGRILSARFSPDRLVLETTDGAMTYRVGGHFSIAALSLDGGLLATGAPGGDLRLWDVVTGREIERHEVPLAIQAVQFSADGRLIVASFRRRPGESVDIACLYVIDLRSGKLFGPIDLGESEGLFEEFALSPSGEIAFTWFEKGGYALWRVRGESTIRTPLSPMPHQAAGQEKNEPEPDLRELRFSEDGRRALAFSPHGWIWVWDVATADLIFTSDGFPDLDPDVGPWLEDVLLTEDGHLLARWGGGDLYTARLEDSEAERKLNIQAGPPEGCRGFTGTIFPAPTPGIFFHAGKRLSLHRIEDCSEIIAADAESRRFFAKSETPLRIMLGTEGGMVLAVDRAAKMLEWKDRLPQILARLQADANDAEALTEIGAWYAFRDLWEQALSAFRRAELAGSKSIPALDRARAHWQVGRIEEAEEGFLSLVAREGPEAVYASVCLRALQRLRETEY